MKDSIIDKSTMLEIRQWTFTSLICIDKNLLFCGGSVQWVALFVNDFYRKCLKNAVKKMLDSYKIVM